MPDKDDGFPIAAVHAAYDAYQANIDVLRAEVERLRAENTRLREALSLVKDWPAVGTLDDEKMATIQQTLEDTGWA